jgi:uncharacterized lipoprotein YbaY/heat shock protein HslJ
MMRSLVLFVVAAGSMIGAIGPAPAEEVLTGTASFRERMVLPPDAVFEAVLEEVSRADAPAVEIARTRIENPGQPPIAFAIRYESSAIDERMTYVVRSRIYVGDRLLFTSDTAHHVLTRGRPRDVAMMMRMIERRSEARQPGDVVTGMFVYMADAARLTECRTRRSVPVAMEGDYLRLERAYLAARPGPGEPLMVTFEGRIEERPRIEGEGTEATAIVSRFIHAWPGESCERNLADASLINTYWRIVNLGADEIHVGEGQREPHLILRTGEPRFAATVGCNQMAGAYQLADETLRFGSVASTMMACPPPLDRLEQSLGDVLANTRSWRIHAQFLELFDEGGQPIALLQAVYLR